MRTPAISIHGVAWLWGLLAGIALLPLASAEENAPPPMVERIIAALKSGEDLGPLTQAEGSANWEHAEALLTRPGGDAIARALAEAWADPDAAALRRYIELRIPKPHRPEALRALSEAEAAVRGELVGAAKVLLEGLEVEPESVAGLMAAALRAKLLLLEGRLYEAATLDLDAAGAAERIGWRTRAVKHVVQAANVLSYERDFRGARDAYERGYNLLRGRGDPDGAATLLGDFASACAKQGDYLCARVRFLEAIEALEASKQWRLAGLTRSNLAHLHLQLGEFERGLTYADSAIAILEQHGEANVRAEALMLLGDIRLELGQLDRALTHHAAAVEIMRAHLGATRKPNADDLFALAATQGSLGNTYMVMGRHADAEAALLAALEVFEKRLGDPYSIAIAMANLGELAFRRGDYVGALARTQGAVQSFEQLSAEEAALTPRLTHCRILMARGDNAEAQACLLETRASAERLRFYGVAVQAMTDLAELHLRAGKPQDAEMLAFGAVDLLGGSLAHLADGEGAAAREHRLRTYQLPIRVALAQDDAEACAEALDEARAGAFLESFGGRRVLSEIALPADLHRRLRAAEEDEKEAWAARRRAEGTGVLPRVREAGDRLKAARASSDAIHESMQRTAKRGADLVYPRAAELPLVQAELAPHEALVVYGLLEEASIALVITSKKATIARLGSEREILAACEALHASKGVYVDASKGPALAKQLVAPLNLPAAVTRVLISPDGTLAYVPFSLLMPEREVAYVPSGTAYLALRAQKDLRGKEIVAFGDPDYSRHKGTERPALYRGPLVGRLGFDDLEESGPEAREVGTLSFVGEKATEANIRASVKPTRKRPRLRALHLAGHGFANTDNPQLSCIVLAPEGDDDGILLAREVMGMEIPADLVVLSACESVRGRVVRAEGLQGLAQAFLFAGSPRVLATLWKVDDPAAREFVRVFYGHWNPKTGTPKGAATALRLTQEHMRQHKEFHAADHWSGWVLWGLPD